MRSLNLSALVCIGLCASCAQQGSVGNTEINLTIGTDFGPQDGEAAFEADRVDYRITCVGTVPGTFPIPPDATGGVVDYDDSVEISGSFEIIDGQDPPVWNTIMDLPPGDCTASLTVYRGGEVVCEGAQGFTVVENGTTKIDIKLLCSLSVNIGDGAGDADGEFQFTVGNECPKIFDFRAIPAVIPLGESSAIIQTIARDLDGTCGSNCDPQTCDDANPPNCTPGPDPGLTLELSTLVGTFDDSTAAITNYNCDPAFPGPMQVCVDVSDGDLDCDKAQCTVVECPDPCEGIVCDDGNECTADYCDPATELCVFDVAPDDIACASCSGTCQASVCDLGSPFVGAQSAPIMPFVGAFRFVNGPYLNPYDGFFVVLPLTYVFRNTTTYFGPTVNDAILGTHTGDFLFLSDPFFIAPQTVCDVEQFLAGNGGDFAHFADKYINTIPMQFFGNNANDILWANAGDDFLDGGRGNDILDGGPGSDIILGGLGIDLITMGHDNGTDSVFGGSGPDQLSINALASQITIAPAANPSYEFDIFYLSTWIAQVTEVEELITIDTTTDLTTCVAGVCPLCGNGVLNGGEECEDGNLVNGDGCASDCTVE
jgi:cysteine-rich repeat protein